MPGQGGLDHSDEEDELAFLCIMAITRVKALELARATTI